eukprot:TRINITY_DN11558_c0_g1_i1.p1 TRINITY_DN11558_c0_g1~~TRINITY_DN11558_c0_g1_i1.p1  ORF type:complete len:422 (-),score=31.81 TRINITY_DN11558_c0_g1_i1:61-1326(-)
MDSGCPLLEKEPPKPDSRWALFLLLLASFTYTFTVGTYFSYGILVEPLQQEFDVGRAMIVGAGSLASGLGISSSFVWGILSDKYGFRSCALFGVITFAGSFYATSHITAVWQLYLTYGVGVGVGMSLVWMPLIGCIAQWFEKKRGLAFGILFASGGLGSLIQPLLFDKLFELYGWRETLRMYAYASMLMAFAVIFIRRRVSMDANFNIVATFKDPTFIRIAAGLVIMSLGYMPVFFHIAVYAEDKGLTTFDSAVALSILGSASTVGRLAMGFLGDRLGHFKVLRWSMLILGIIVSVWVTAESKMTIFALCGSFGFFAGAMVSSISPSLATFFGAAQVSTLSGMVWLFYGPGYIFGPILVGLSFDHFGNYYLGAGLCGASILVGTLVLFTVRERTKPEYANPISVDSGDDALDGIGPECSDV